MSVLKKAPLVEVISEIRWGGVPDSESGDVNTHFSGEEVNFFPGQFLTGIKEKGFTYFEQINQGIQIPHIVTSRFRKEKDKWPCCQIGLGLLSVNQINDGYDWDIYIQDVETCLQVLNSSLPNGLSGVKPIGLEIRYRDGFSFEEGEKSADFLNEKFNITYKSPEQLLSADLIDSSNEKIKVSFKLKTIKPEGMIQCTLVDSLINGKPGIVLDTIVRSSIDQGVEPQFESIKGIIDWYIMAHDLQRHAFESIINPAFLKTLK